MNKDIKLHDLTFAAIMCALCIILNRAIPPIGPYHITLDFLPIFVVAYRSGGFLACMTYGVADTLGSMMIPTGVYNPAVTATLMLIGLAYGFIFNTKSARSLPLVVKSLIAALMLFIIKAFITTAALLPMYGAGETYMGFVMLRAPSCAIVAAASFALVPFIAKLLDKIA